MTLGLGLSTCSITDDRPKAVRPAAFLLQLYVPISMACRFVLLSYTRPEFHMWCLYCPNSFLISSFFGFSGGLCFVIVAFTGYPRLDSCFLT